MTIKYFHSRSELRSWLKKNHSSKTELVIGFYKKASGRKGISYAEALDEALCFGWIDGVRRRVDDASFSTRFTPRRRGSNWSLVNIKKVKELSKLGLMHPAGLEAFDKRDEAKSRLYSHEQRNVALDSAYKKKFRANKKAWTFFESQPPSYRRPATWWVMSAKKEETRLRRLATLIKDSEDERRVVQFTSPRTR